MAHFRLKHLFRFKTALTVIVVGGVLGVLVAWVAFRGDSSADSLVTAKVEKGDVEETVSAVGVLQPLEYVDVGTQVTGQLKTLHVAIGDRVKAGALLAEIDPTLFRAAVDKTRASLDNLRAQLADKLAQKRLAEQQNARSAQLYAEKAASAEVVEQTTAAEAQASAQVDSLQAQIRQSQSQLSADEANLRYTKIYAPMTGTVVLLSAKQGQTLVASQQAPTILRVADLSTMTVWAQTSEADVPKIKVGMEAYFNTLGEPTRRWHGKVRQILPTPETVNNVVLYDVLFDAENPDLALKPQMSAQVFFVLARAEDAALVPTAALNPVRENARGAGRSKDGGGRVFKVSMPGEDKPVDRLVTVGISNRIQAQVLSGLNVGDTVIVGSDAKKAKSASRSGGSGAAPRGMMGPVPH
jgi:membrane fusion protein, macrolide-specific efflux system